MGEMKSEPKKNNTKFSFGKILTCVSLGFLGKKAYDAWKNVFRIFLS